MDTTSTNDTRPARWRRWVLPVSLLLNLFLIALIAGFVLHNPVTRGTAAGGPLGRTLANLESRLSPQDARAFNSVLARDLPRTSAAAQKLTAARLELARQVAAEKYDPEATRQALSAWRTSWDGFIQDFSDTLVDGLGQVSPEGRRQLLLATERRRERMLGPSIP